MVTHCVCHNISFDELRRLAAARGLDLDGLKACTGCCTSCGTCEPYVALMLKTGRTSLPILDAAACERLRIEAAAAESRAPIAATRAAG